MASNKAYESVEQREAAVLVIFGQQKDKSDADKYADFAARGLACWNTELSDKVDLPTILLNFLNTVRDGDQQLSQSEIGLRFEIGPVYLHIVTTSKAKLVREALQNIVTNISAAYKHIVFAGRPISDDKSFWCEDGRVTSDFVCSSLLFDHTADWTRFGHVLGHIRLCSPCNWTDSDFSAANVKSDQFQVSCASVPSKECKSTQIPSEFVQFLRKIMSEKWNSLETLMPSSEAVGFAPVNSNLNFYVFPAGEEDSAMLMINGYSVVFDGGSEPKPSYWHFIRHLANINLLVITRAETSSSMRSVTNMIERKAISNCAPNFDVVIANVPDVASDGANSNGEMSVLQQVGSLRQGLSRLQVPVFRLCSNVRMEPVTLFEQYGVGKLQVIALNPSEKELDVFGANLKQSKGDMNAAARDTSLAVLLVWLPADHRKQTIRVLYPGACPLDKLYTSLDKLKSLDYLKVADYVKRANVAKRLTSSQKTTGRLPTAPVASKAVPVKTRTSTAPAVNKSLGAAGTGQTHKAPIRVADSKKPPVAAAAKAGTHSTATAASKNQSAMGSSSNAKVIVGKVGSLKGRDEKKKTGSEETDQNRPPPGNEGKVMTEGRDLIDRIEEPMKLMKISMDTEDLEKTLLQAPAETQQQHIDSIEQSKEALDVTNIDEEKEKDKLPLTTAAAADYEFEQQEAYVTEDTTKKEYMTGPTLYDLKEQMDISNMTHLEDISCPFSLEETSCTPSAFEMKDDRVKSAETVLDESILSEGKRDEEKNAAAEVVFCKNELNELAPVTQGLVKSITGEDLHLLAQIQSENDNIIVPDEEERKMDTPPVTDLLTQSDATSGGVMESELRERAKTLLSSPDLSPMSGETETTSNIGTMGRDNLISDVEQEQDGGGGYSREDMDRLLDTLVMDNDPLPPHSPDTTVIGQDMDKTDESTVILNGNYEYRGERIDSSAAAVDDLLEGDTQQQQHIAAQAMTGFDEQETDSGLTPDFARMNISSVADNGHVQPTLEELKKEWGEPLSLPVLNANKKTPTTRSSTVSGSAALPPAPAARSTGVSRAGLADARQKPKKRVELSSAIYVDVAYIPHHGDAFAVNAQFFSLIRAKYYVLSGRFASKKTLDAWLAGKKAWKRPDLQSNLVPTYDSEQLSEWLLEKEGELSGEMMDVKASSERCQLFSEATDDTPCAAYKIQF